MFTVEPLKAHLFDPQYTKLINEAKLRNVTMHKIIDLMSISRPGSAKERRGRISYSALGINQMGAVYEALLSYRGFIAEEDLYEVKRAGDKFNELDVGYFVPEGELDKYTEDERVRYEDYERKGKLRMYEKGTFIYRLAGREREKSASYYTPEVLTKCLVKYALKELLKDKKADEILNLTICEPAMGSAAFLNEAITQLAEAYLDKKQEEIGEQIAFDQRQAELQKVKMFIADRNVYGVDLNPIAVELAEVSIWLNTIYKGAHVPWFGTQLACGNSLIGARRQVYNSLKLKKGNWFNDEPEKVTEEWVTDRHQSRKVYKRRRPGASYIYHFLLGDPGMANYTDKVIKGLEPEKIKRIKQWQKEFCAKYSDEDIEVLNKLSDIIDDLWMRTIYARQAVEIRTEDTLSVYGHDEGDYKEHLTIREKDTIYNRIYKSEGGENASPYARLKAAMDYWCALWFWPIEKADLLPDRQKFFMEMSLILEGGIAATVKKQTAVGQMSFILDEQGEFIGLGTEGSELANKVQAQIDGLGAVNLTQLRSLYPELKIANEIAQQQHFMHWELEFADLFYERSGFDLVIGNPPWIKVEWNEMGILSEKYPNIVIKGYSSNELKEQRKDLLKSQKTKDLYLKEYEAVSGQQAYLNSIQNYSLLKGSQTNEYKCFLPTAWIITNSNAVSAYIHPEGVFDDPKGRILRRTIYNKLVYHFQFQIE
ncbi:MAG: N-6 DNA methylase, partial [Oscillospiraceae bacterium]|nr:N-6 DNA methylase [Oscillospiraceae bacterium]